MDVDFICQLIFSHLIALISQGPVNFPEFWNILSPFGTESLVDDQSGFTNGASTHELILSCGRIFDRQCF